MFINSKYEYSYTHEFIKYPSLGLWHKWKSLKICINKTALIRASKYGHHECCKSFYCSLNKCQNKILYSKNTRM